MSLVIYTNKNMEDIIKCHRRDCRKTFLKKGKTWKKKYCSNDCLKLDTGTQTFFNETKVLNSSKLGAISEVYVAFDLMKKGYDVYRALSPSSDSDLVAIKKDVVLTVEVKTGKYNSTGGFNYCKKNIKSSITAVVLYRDSKIIYIPDLPIK